MKAADISGITEGLDLSKRFIANAVERAFLDGGLARNPYKSQAMVLNGNTLVLALFGGNQCIQRDTPIIRLGNDLPVPAAQIENDDWILGFDIETMAFVYVRVKGIYVNEPRPILRFRHRHGFLDCTASEKFLRTSRGRDSRRLEFARANRCWRNQYSCVVRSPGGGVELSVVDCEGQFGIEETVDFIVDHPSHAFVAGGIVVANSGKSHAAAHKVAWEATGLYPDHGWYTGRRSVRGQDIWVVGDTNENTRDACQKKLFGPDPDRPGWTDTPEENALIPAKYIVGKPTRRQGIPGAFDTAYVKHVPSDTVTKITFKSHAMDQQALASWTGDVVWVDEEPPKEKFDELIMRIIRRKGQLIMSFTPLKGMTDLVAFLLKAPASSVTRDFLGWDQARHLSEGAKAEIRAMYASQPGILQARMEGRPTTNSGLIFPFSESDISYDPAKISISSRLLYLGGLDIGWRHPTGAVAVAWDPRSDVAYLYASYRVAEKPFGFHHAQLLNWGENMTFMIDPASNQSGPGTGMKVLEEYWKLAHGKNYEEIEEQYRKYIKANRAFLPTMDEMWHRFETRRLLVNRNCLDWFEEYHGYAWNDEGTGPVKERDDLIDPTRYCVKDLRQYAHRMDQAPPWLTCGDDPDSFESIPSVREWEKYRAGRSR